ncbi:hypothetical protein AGMMS49587_14300 [Spirochaetia bacterium]|nr:hypothetical protein AGMMS49587_14300 [Spirochaetia bacterium]
MGCGIVKKTRIGPKKGAEKQKASVKALEIAKEAGKILGKAVVETLPITIFGLFSGGDGGDVENK